MGTKFRAVAGGFEHVDGKPNTLKGRFYLVENVELEAAERTVLGMIGRVRDGVIPALHSYASQSNFISQVGGYHVEVVNGVEIFEENRGGMGYSFVPIGTCVYDTRTIELNSKYFTNKNAFDRLWGRRRALQVLLHEFGHLVGRDYLEVLNGKKFKKEVYLTWRGLQPYYVSNKMRCKKAELDGIRYFLGDTRHVGSEVKNRGEVVRKNKAHRACSEAFAECFVVLFYGIVLKRLPPVSDRSRMHFFIRVFHRVLLEMSRKIDWTKFGLTSGRVAVSRKRFEDFVVRRSRKQGRDREFGNRHRVDGWFKVEHPVKYRV